jgi:hypothetical protein
MISASLIAARATLQTNIHTSLSLYAADKAMDIAKRCLTCITVDGNPGWACTQYCATTAKSTTEMSTCSACLMSGKRGINTWVSDVLS